MKPSGFHPWEIVTAVEQRCQFGYLMVLMKVLPAGERTGKQPDGITCRDLHVFPSFPGMDVNKVIEPSIRCRHLAVCIATKNAADAVLCRVARDPLPLRANAESREAEARNTGAATRLVALLRVVDRIAMNQIPADSRLRIARVPEVAEAAVRKIIQQSMILMPLPKSKAPGRAHCACRASNPSQKNAPVKEYRLCEIH